MKHMEEGNAYRRSKSLRCLYKAGTVCGHNSGESLKWAPKVQRRILEIESVLISQASGQSSFRKIYKA